MLQKERAQTLYYVCCIETTYKFAFKVYNFKLMTYKFMSLNKENTEILLILSLFHF